MTIKKLKSIDIINVLSDLVSEKLETTVKLPTHTHVPTGDEKILPKGTAFQCDVGMTGPYESVIGCEKEAIIERSVKGIMTPFRVVEDEGQFCATLLHFDGNKCTNIERIRIDPQVKFK